MFESIKQITANAKKLNQTQLLIEVFTDVKIKDEIVYYITEVQLFKEGVDGLGDKLKQYTPFTISIKESKTPKQPTDRTTLKDTGQFYNSFRVDVNQGGEVKIVVNDINDLTEKYGINILTLSDDGIEKIKPQVIEKIKEYVIRTLHS